MSNIIENAAEPKLETKPCNKVKRIIKAKAKDLGGFEVRRALPIKEQRMLGPWIFFDHMGPAEFPIGEGINVRPHPHINLATVTYLFEGKILHQDSVGSYQVIEPGDINLMFAGRGIVHSERTKEEWKKEPRKLNGLQLWMAVPEEIEEEEPAFYHYNKKDIPEVVVDEIPVRVMMGTAYGVTSPVKCFSETLYFEARLKKGQRLKVASAEERAIYVTNGKLKIDNTQAGAFEMIVLENHDDIFVEALEDSFIALVGGSPLGKRHMFWNFASSDKERIEQAKLDWKNGIFDLIPTDKEEFIPLPE